MRDERIVERLHDLVLWDQRLNQLGLRGLAQLAFQIVSGRIPTAEEIRQVMRDFWEFWHKNHDKV